MVKSRFQAIVLQFLYSYLFKYIISLFNPIKIKGHEVFNEVDHFIIVANHKSHWDTIKILSVLPRRILWKVRPIAAEDYFGNTKIKRICSNFFINTLLINRNSFKCSADNPIDKMLNILNKGYSLLIYPEGTRKHGGTMEEMKTGVARLLIANRSLPYIPICISSNSKSMIIGKAKYVKGSQVNEILDEIKSEYYQINVSFNTV